MFFEDFLRDSIGEFGLHQFLVFIFCGIVGFYGNDSIAQNFIGGLQTHWCSVEELVGLPHSLQQRVAIPPSGTDPAYSSCDQYALNYSSYSLDDFLTWNSSEHIDNSTVTVACSGWVYDQSQYVATITSEWNLVCENKWLGPLVSTIFMFGVLIGSISSGVISDKIGRRPATFIFILLHLVAGLLSTFAPNYATFVAARFFIGIGNFGAWLTAYVILLELVGNSYRPLLGMLIFNAGAIGNCMVSVWAAGIREHVRLQFVMTAPQIVCVLGLFILPESPRWLIVHKRFAEAEAVLRRMAAVNGREWKEGTDITTIRFKGDEEMKEKRQGAWMKMIKSPLLMFRMAVLCLHWFTDSLMYYALSLNTGYLAGDIYLNTFLMGAVDIPAAILCYFCLDFKYLGRRWTSGLSLVLAGASAFITVPLLLTGSTDASTAMSLIGKCFVTVAFCAIYVYTTELLPTEVRNGGMGFASMCARISGMAASYIGGPLTIIWLPLPYVIFGTLGTVTGLLTLTLPETLGVEMPQTVEEAEELGRMKKSSTSYSLKLNESDWTEMSSADNDPTVVKYVYTGDNMTNFSATASTEQIKE